jgi:hypothetical protein
MILSDICKFVNAGPPVDAGTAGLDGVYVSMANYDHLTAVVQLGTTSGAAPTITVEKSATGSGAGTAIAFRLRESVVAYNATGGDGYYAALGYKLSTGYGMTTTDNVYAVIELDGIELGGSQYVRVRLNDPGSVNDYASILYILSEARYPESSQSTAIKV